MGTPYVIEGEGPKEKHYDLYSRLLKDRIIFVAEDFDDNLANSIVGQLLFLEADDRDKDIYMYINSPGGMVASMYAIYDTMTYLKPDIVTVGYGQCCSAASFILAAGTPGKRCALPNAEIMIHELSSGASGKFHDIKVRYEHLLGLRDRMAKHYHQFTGEKHSLAKIRKDMETDRYMSPEEAVEYGLIDKVQYGREG